MGEPVVTAYIYRNKENDHIIEINGVRNRAHVILRRARSRSSFGACVTASPLAAWILYPKQVFGFASDNGGDNIHICGFDQGPFAWEDYNGDYYELSAVDIELLDKIRHILSETEFQSIVAWIEEIGKLLQHINWLANEYTFPITLEECCTENDRICFYLNNVVVLLSRYFLDLKKQLFV